MSGQQSAAGGKTTRLFLTGYRGTGKSTVARLLADELGWAWVDSDDQIEAAAGRTIADIFARDGEPAFRDLEESVIAELCRRKTTVIALGGGAVLRGATRERLRQAGPAVWLTATPATLAGRLAGDATTATRRPNLTAGGGLAEIERVLAERTPIYRAVADLDISTEDLPPDEVARQVARWLRDTAAP